MGKKRIAQKGIGEEKTKAVRTGGSLAKKKTRKSIEAGRIYIKASYNNTVITVTDDKGDVIAWTSAGALGYSGPKKATPFAASKVIEAIVEKIAKTGPHTVEIYVSGIGPGRDSAIRSLANSGLDVVSISDITSIPHNGPRPRKARRA